MKPLFVDLYCGLGGWAEGILAEGGDVVGFDIEQHVYGAERYPGQLVLQDVLTLTGQQFKGKICAIVASPPCQKYSYMAMPWSKSKALAAWYREDAQRIEELTAMFRACFRIAREAEVPLIVENVCGAQPWVGQAGWHYGSFYLWGDLPALMPMTKPLAKVPGLNCKVGSATYSGGAFNDTAIKNLGGSWFNVAHNTESGKGQNPDGRKLPGFRFDGSGKSFQTAAVKVGGDWFGTYAEQKEMETISPGRLHGKNSPKRKHASAQIAKIPFPLASHIARTFMSRMEQVA